jgi:hypothetical protein
MIRCSLPLPVLYRLWTRTERKVQSSPAVVPRPPLATPPAQSSLTQPAPAPSAAQPITAAAQDDWMSFTDHYEAFTGLLCSAAKSGCTAESEAEYIKIRSWFLTNYSRISPRLQPLLAAQFSESSFPDEEPAQSAECSCGLDPLKDFFLPVRLADLLAQDAGDLIPKIMQISEAVYRTEENH